MPTKRGSGKAYNTDQEALADAEARWAKERFEAESKMHAETAHLLGIPLAAWMKRRTEALEAGRDRRLSLYGSEAPSGPFVDGSEEWHSRYRELLTAGNQDIMDRKMTKSALAALVLEAFRGNLSASAVARWSAIAKETP